MSEEPLRYPLTEGRACWHYGPWEIYEYSGIALHPSCDWVFTHEDFDGPGDHRHGTGSTRDECIAEINRWEDEREDTVTLAHAHLENDDAK